MSSQRKIIIAVDKNEISSLALQWAIANILRPTDHALVLNCLSYAYSDALPSVDLASAGEYAVPLTSPDIEIDEKASEEAKQLIEKFIKQCEAAKIPCEGAVVRGDPGSHIVEWATKIGADAIVVGSHGYGVIQRAFKGSISDYVLHNASVPVAIVRFSTPPKSSIVSASSICRKIVIAVDNTNEAAFAFTWALENICTGADNVVILHVQSNTLTPTSLTAEDLAMDDIYVPVSVNSASNAQLLGDSEKLVERFMQFAASQTKIHCEGKVVSGSASEKIVEELVKLEADMVVVGTHDYGVVARTLLGSVSDHLVHSSPCPIIVAKIPKSSGSTSDAKDHVHSG